MAQKVFKRVLTIILTRLNSVSLPRFIVYKKTKVPIDKILMGGENDISGWKYALMSGDLARCSTRISDGPHVNFLHQYKRIGNEVFEPSSFQATEYCRNVTKCIDIFGEYFPGVVKPNDSLPLAKFFAEQLDQTSKNSLSTNLIELVRINESDCFQLIQGNHRLALKYVRGEKYVYANVKRRAKEITPIIFLLNLLRWENGEKILYQPLPFPELDAEWVTARKCVDRFNLMKEFLAHSNLAEKTYLDIGSYYGWFLNEFANIDFEVTGIEKDYVATQIGKIAYPSTGERVAISDAYRYLKDTEKIYEVVSCLSVLHHQITGRDKGDAVKTLKEIDRHTGKVLFFEMGQDSEIWFEEALSGWNTETIQNWVLDNTTFTSCEVLGFDEDNIGQFEGNYKRALFAFTRG